MTDLFTSNYILKQQLLSDLAVNMAIQAGHREIALECAHARFHCLALSFGLHKPQTLKRPYAKQHASLLHSSAQYFNGVLQQEGTRGYSLQRVDMIASCTTNIISTTHSVVMHKSWCNELQLLLAR